MPRVHAETCDCDCKMKRLYIRADGGKGWKSVGWMCVCGCGCINLDQGSWKLMECCSRGGD